MSDETKEKIRHSLMGKRNQKNRSVVEARYILEKKIGRKLLPNEITHHIDEDYTNNHEDNLEAMDAQEHRSYHAKKQGLGKIRTNFKITDTQIKEIINSGNIRADILSKKYNVSNLTIYYIWRKYGRNGETKRKPTKCLHSSGNFLDKFNRKRCNKCKRYLKK